MRSFRLIKRAAGLVAITILWGCEEDIPPPVYQLVPVEARDVVVSVSAAGTIEPIKTVEVKSKASGEIVAVLVDTGDPVRTGQILVRVDPRIPRNTVIQAEADLDVAKAELANAESQLERSEALYETQSITEQEWENARLQHASARARLVRSERALEDARIAFEDTEVRAASPGVILSRRVEIGTVIQSASGGFGGGEVLLTMANLDTVQIRTLVDETDIGKVSPNLDVTITVDAYPNQPFRGQVLKIEPQAVEEQNVTMFPVLVRIANRASLLRPGMNSEVEIHIGERRGVITVPNAALRTQRDVAAAAQVLGLDPVAVQEQLAAALDRRSSLGGATANGPGGAAAPSEDDNTIEFNGRTVTLPAGLSREQVQPILAKMGRGGGPGAFQSLSSDERSIMQRVFRAAGGGRGGPGGRGGRGGGGQQQQSNFQFGGDYIVFVLTPDGPEARPIRTGLTDLDNSEVVSGLEDGDSVMVLPSASLIQQQQQRSERIRQMTGGGGLPGTGGNRGRR